MSFCTVSAIGGYFVLLLFVIALQIPSDRCSGTRTPCVYTPKDCSNPDETCRVCDDAKEEEGEVNATSRPGIASKTEKLKTHKSKCGGPPPPPTNKSLPQYLVIGDFIMRQLYPSLKQALDGEVDISVNPGVPKSISAADGLKCIATWMGKDPKRWDVVSFGFGAYEAARPNIFNATNATYISALSNITEYILKNTKSETKVIFVLTPPIANTSHCCPCPCDIDIFNSVATRLFQGYYRGKVIIDDVWSWINRYCCHEDNCYYDRCSIQPIKLCSHCRINFSDNGWEYMAKNVSQTVKSALNL